MKSFRIHLRFVVDLSLICFEQLTTTNGAVYVHGEKKDTSWTGIVNKVREANDNAHKDGPLLVTHHGLTGPVLL